MTDTTTLYVPVITSPVAALLVANGVAQFIGDLGKHITGEVVKVRTANTGSYIVVEASAALSPKQVQPSHYQHPAFAWIRTAKNSDAPDTLPQIDYEAERQHNAAYYEEIRRLQQGGVSIRSLQPEQQNDLASRAPRSYWPVVAMVNQMSALTTYNSTVRRWHECHTIYPELVALVWTLFSGQPDALERAEQEWVRLAKQHNLDKSLTLPATQIVNPEQGKGANRPKADALTIGGQDSFWLLEYFKFAGLHGSALPRTVQSKKDRKTYVVVPSSGGVEQRWHKTVFTQFQKEFWASSAIKMDILAALRYTSTMLETWQGAQSSGRQRRPSDFIEGFAVVSYKDLGSAFAVMNVATIGLPDWITWPDNAANMQPLIESLALHQRLVGMLDEKKGEEEQLLRDYRDFLSSRDPNLVAFFRFTTGYAGHAMRKLSRRQPVLRLATADLETIIIAQEEQRSMKLKPLVENSGFLRVATAIRRSTVTQQYHRSQNGDTTYDIRYGLADDLQRHSRNAPEFMRALGEFIKDYSQENARVMERMTKQGRKEYPRRPPITTDDLAELTELVDTYGSPTVASMLIAFGYARDPKASDGEQSAQSSTTTDEALPNEPTTDSQDEESRY